MGWAEKPRVPPLVMDRQAENSEVVFVAGRMVVAVMYPGMSPAWQIRAEGGRPACARGDGRLPDQRLTLAVAARVTSHVVEELDGDRSRYTDIDTA